MDLLGRLTLTTALKTSQVLTRTRFLAECHFRFRPYSLVCTRQTEMATPGGSGSSVRKDDGLSSIVIT
jgi:hypothetical protein